MLRLSSPDMKRKNYAMSSKIRNVRLPLFLVVLIVLFVEKSYAFIKSLQVGEASCRISKTSN